MPASGKRTTWRGRSSACGRGKLSDERAKEAASAVADPVDRTAIAGRPYDIFLERGAEAGRDIEHRFRAEAELPNLRS